MIHEVMPEYQYRSIVLFMFKFESDLSQQKDDLERIVLSQLLVTNFNPCMICNYKLQSIGFTLMDRVLQSQMSGCQNSFAKVELINTDKLLCNIIHEVLIL